jgi:hypothetical protein
VYSYSKDGYKKINTGLFSVRLRHVTVNQKQQTDTGLFSVRLTHVTVNQTQQTDAGLFSESD